MILEIEMETQKLHSAKTVNGQAVEIRINDSVFLIDEAAVAAIDGMTGKGVVCVIDEFIFPN
jgi:uncharacterized surface protein with fasciclin (FAS1) repeats